MHNFYLKMKRDLAETLNAEGFEKDYTIRDDVNEKNVIIDLKQPLSGDALAMFEEILKSVVTFFCWDLGLWEKPKYAFVNQTCVSVQKSFDDSNFKY